jgi:hypothetical protein
MPEKKEKKSTKQKQTGAGKKTNKTYAELCAEAIKEDGSRRGSSLPVIKKYIQENYDVPENFNLFVNKALRK